ncbi:MAG TPA: L-threonine 3-dehydrogenase [Gemmatimonadales bacterium]|nr:L-threonine 3-dehydrogenase [Gemmatimonadales bacterium]
MRAIRKTRPAPGLEVVDAPEPRAGPHDVLIRVRHAGVCGTDLHIADWDEWAQERIRPPLILGHEFAGEIVAVGSDVGDAFHVGQLVTAEGHIVCGHCRQCRSGNGHICQRTQIIGVDRDGAFAELLAMPAGNVMALNGIPTTTGAIMDPLGNAFHTVLTGDVSGATVLVLGCGPIGCFAVGIARAAGAARVIASDVNPTRLALARRMGAHELLDPSREDVTARVSEITSGEGADLVCEMSGSHDAVRQALRCVRLGGRVNLLGLPKGDVALHLSTDLIFKGITVYGVIGRRMFETWDQMHRFLASGLLDPTPVITHTFPLEAINDALATIRSGQAGKVILEIGSKG